MTSRHHIMFIEDDEAEIATFRRLYEGDEFELTGLCIQFPRSVLPALGAALGDRVPDLFVLDLFFPPRQIRRVDSPGTRSTTLGLI
jgi:hypothetical protein